MEKEKSKKDLKQEEFVKLYLDYRLHTLKHGVSPNSTIISATGTGKSKITMLILEEIHTNYNKIYIIVNQDSLRDRTWKEDFLKWDKQHILNKTELVNYQSAYKWTKDLGNAFIVYDEVDYAIGTPIYSKVFTTYKNVHSLGLTGYCALVKREELNKLLPILVDYLFDEAVKDGVINDVQFVFVKYDLDKDKNGIIVKYKKNGIPKEFSQSENDAYDYADMAFRIAYGKYEEGVKNSVLGIISDKELKQLEWDMKRKRDSRLKILYNCIASVKVAKTLVNDILKDPNNKVIIFSRYTQQCDRISKDTYHSKNSKEVNNYKISMFNKGIIRSLGVCSKIDRGENLVGLNNAIIESYTSSDTVLSQKRGRGNRLDINEVCIFYVLLPYFMRKQSDGSYKLAETQAITWARNMLHDYQKVNNKIIDLRTIKE